MDQPSDANSTTAATTSADSASSSANTPSPKCAHCDKAPETLKQCNRCHTISYCSKECQKSHFKAHKKECAALAQAYMSINEPKMATRAPPRESDRNTGFKKWQFDT